MNISNLLSRLHYWGRWYYLLVLSKFSDSQPYLRHQAREHLKEASPKEKISKKLDVGSRRGAVSIAILVLVLGGIFVFGFDTQWGGGSYEVRDQLSRYVNILWQVQAGLLSVGFVVIVLLMQVLGGRDKLSGYVFKEYVRRSKVLTVAFLGLSSIAVMGFTALSGAHPSQSIAVSVSEVIFNSLLLSINLIAIGFVYWHIVRFVKPGHSVELTAELLRRNLRRSFHNLVLEAFAERLLILEASNTGFEYSATLPRQGNPQEVAYPVGSKPLQVRDVDLQKLRDVSNSLNREQPTGPKGWIRAKIGTTLSFSNPHVGYLESGATETDNERFIDCFVVEEGTDDDAGWEASAENLKNRARRAVNELRPSDLSNLLDVYVNTLRHYVRYVEEYDPEALTVAFDDPLSMNQYWRPDKKLYRDFRELARRAIKEDDRDLVEGVLYLPIRVMRFAQSKSSPDLFQQFAGAYTQFYNAAHSLPASSDARRFTLDRSWRHLRDYARRMSLRYLDQPGRTFHIVENARYAQLILKVFNRLMKRALDLRDEDSLLTFLRKFNSVFDDVKRTRDELRTALLRIERSSGENASNGNNNSGGNEASESLRILKKAEDAAENVLTTKSFIRFGISAWILDLYQRDQVDEPQMSGLIAKVSKQFDDIEDFYQIYIQALDAEWNDQFHWDTWDDARHDRGDETEFRAVTTKTWLRRFYVAKGLQIIQPGETDLDIPPSAELKTELSKLHDACENVLEDGHPIQDLDNPQQRKKNFLRLHEEALRRQEEKETDQLIEADLEANRVEAFKETFLEHWRENSVDRLLDPFCDVKVAAVGEDESAQSSENYIRVPDQPKNYFTQQTHEEIASEVGEKLGRRFGWEERKVFAHALKRELPTEATTKEQVSKRIEEIVEDCEIDADLLLMGERVTVSEFLLSNSNFVTKHREDNPQYDLPGYRGRFGRVPVCGVGGAPNSVVALDADGITARRLVQEENQVFYVEVDNVTEEKAEELLDEQPSLQNENESRGEVIRRLRQRVMISSGGGHFDFEIDEQTGIVLAVKGDEEK